jgi:NADPH-dependent curcumin reductase CurA
VNEIGQEDTQEMRNSNRQWRLKQRPVGDIQSGDLELGDSPKPVPGAGEILVRNIYLSLDPTNRIWMSDMEQYMPPVAIGDVMRGGTLGVVEQSNADGFAPGDIVLPGMGGWQDYTIASASGPMPARKLPSIPGVSLSSYMSALGATGATAYFGLLDLGKPQTGETVVVSAAAGAVGQIVGQIAKIKGCRVVGLAGSDEKCRHVVKDFGFDACINYKQGNLAAALKRECPKGIDVDFENAGGQILDAVLANINLKARIVLCGLISQYNAKEPVPGPYNFANILMKRARVEGFIIIDYLPRFGEFAMQMAQWLMEGKVKDRVDIHDGLENAVTTLQQLFVGGNTGKLLVRVSPEP